MSNVTFTLVVTLVVVNILFLIFIFQNLTAQRDNIKIEREILKANILRLRNINAKSEYYSQAFDDDMKHLLDKLEGENGKGRKEEKD